MSIYIESRQTWIGRTDPQWDFSRYHRKPISTLKSELATGPTDTCTSVITPLGLTPLDVFECDWLTGMKKRMAGKLV
jgi:hypothetical protein